ncbi:MAG: MFS transporter, partial [Novosphingobium sp.]
ARSVGPALGGILISLWSTSLAFAINALSYLGMIVVLSRWRPESLPPMREPMLAAIGRGLHFCASSSPIRKVLLRGFAIGFGAAGLQALMPSIARDVLKGSELDYGLMLGGFGIGSIITALWISKIRRHFGSEAVVTAATLIFAAAQLLMASATGVPMAIIAAFVGGMGWASAMTSLNVAMQLRSPEDILGRCLSIYQAVTFGGMALGAWAWGTVADIASLQTALHAAAVWLLASLAMHFFAPMPTREEGRLDAVPESKP